MPAGGFAIDRVGPALSPGEFDQRYYLPQRPVIFTGIARDWPAFTRWTPEYLFERLAGGGVAERQYWFDTSAGFLPADHAMPAVLRELAGRRDIRFRADPVRVWISAEGTRTAWHYDGSGLLGLNVQVCGAKRFTLVSPDTPLPCGSFSHRCLAGYAEPAAVLSDRAVHTTFDLRAGDAVFIPLHWLHYVTSIDPCNINLNWVWTDVALLRDSPAAATVREREHLAALWAAGRALRAIGVSRRPGWLQDDYLRTYGGAASYEVVEEIARTVPRWRALARFVREIAQAPADRWARRRNRRAGLLLHHGVERSARDFLEIARTRAAAPSTPSR